MRSRDDFAGRITVQRTRNTSHDFSIITVRPGDGSKVLAGEVWVYFAVIVRLHHEIARMLAPESGWQAGHGADS
jgi:hypothetical protein